MRRTVISAGWIALVWTAIVLRAAEKAPEDYTAAMKQISAFVQAMTQPDAAQDFAKTKEFVPIVRDAFAVVERYWLDRNQDRKYNAEIATAEEAIKFASDMGVAANLQSVEGIAASVKDIGATCQPCHDRRREKGPEGFLIKLD